MSLARYEDWVELITTLWKNVLNLNLAAIDKGYKDLLLWKR